MPVTINGNGTITGLAVGGLPDGTVDGDTLASSIPASKLTGALPAISGAALTGLTAGITEADQWRLTTNVQGDVDPVTGTWERNDNSGFSKIGTGLSQSSGVFSFPSTGIWQITTTAKTYHSDANRWAELMLYTTIDNGTWVKQTEPGGSNANHGSNAYAASTSTFIFDVTSTTDCKVRFAINQEDASSYLAGHTDYNTTHITFIRLGDT